MIFKAAQIKSVFPRADCKRSVNPQIPFPAKKQPIMHAIVNDTTVFLVTSAKITAIIIGNKEIHPIVSNTLNSPLKFYN